MGDRFRFGRGGNRGRRRLKLGRGLGLLDFVGLGLLAAGLAFANPAFDAQLAIDGIGLGKAIVDVGAQGVQGDAPPVVLLDAGQLGASEAAGATDLDSLGAEVFGGLYGLLHRAAEGDAPLQLQGDILRDQLGVHLDARGNVATDVSHMSSVPGVFAAGDMRRGQSLVVWAIAEGRRAAAGIDRYLSGLSG